MFVIDQYLVVYGHGIGVILCLFGIVAIMLTSSLFTPSKIQYFLLGAEVMMLVKIGLFLIGMHSSLLTAIFNGLYTISYCLYPFYRCFDMISKRIRVFIICCYVVTFIGFEIQELYTNNVIDISYSVAISGISGSILFVALITNYLFYKIVWTIKNNPGHRLNVKQTNILKILLFALNFGYIFGLPSAAFVFVSVYNGSGTFRGISFLLQYFVVAVYICANGLMIANKELPIIQSLELSESIFSQKPLTNRPLSIAV